MKDNKNLKSSNPQISAQEKEWLKKLNEYGLMDTLPEREFDEITELASMICGTPVALISLVDESRQWFKSHKGLSETEIPREGSFCSYAILGKNLLVVEDALLDERFKKNALVLGEPKIRFYAGAPLLTSDGFALGTLCVIDYEPKQLNEKQLHALEILGRQVVVNFERLRLMQQKQNKFMTIFDQAPIGIIQLTKEAKFIAMNESYCKFLEYTREELFQLTVLELTHPEDREKTQSAINQFLPHRGSINRFEKRYVTKSGKTVWGLVSSRAIEDEVTGEVTLFSVIEDITVIKEKDEALKQAQLQLIQSSKLASLGEMASGVAHEVNNPLAIIQGKADLLKRRLEKGMLDPQKLMVDLDAISKTVLRIASIIKGLRLFSRNASDDPMIVTSINQVVEETFSLCRERFVAFGVDLKVDFQTQSSLECRATQISQVLMNLLGNAFDAVSLLPEKWVHIEVYGNDAEIKIRVTDSGSGISPLLLKKIMEPFFSTKGAGKGTGLGLSIAKSMVESHQGTLVYDEVNGHTSFLIRLPVTQNREHVQKAA